MTDRVVSTQRAYDSVAEDFAVRTKDHSAGAAEFFERFLGELSGDGRVLDLGCGPGHDLARLASAGYQALGIDRSPGLLALVDPPALAVRADLSAVPFVANGIDAIWSCATLLHVEARDLASTFAEWDRILRPAGVVGFATSLAAASEPNEGWELVPAGAHRRPEIADGQQRWFVHHQNADLLDAVAAVGWRVVWSGVRASHRDWLQVIARKPS